jgi:arylsulfatase A-like enzyme
MPRHLRHWTLLAFAALLLGCGGEQPWNVVLVTFDTTRADRLGCYGNERIETPAIDALAAGGVLFENAYASVPITLPSHTTILTGKNPPGHGVRDNGLFVVSPDAVTLAERLSAEGYRTAAAVGAFPLVAKFGLDQGFDLYDDHLEKPYEDFRGRKASDKAPGLFFDERAAQRVNEAVYPWLEEHAAEPFFLWAHYYDPHQPHNPPTPYDELYPDDPYAAEIAYSDESLGTLIEHLKAIGAWDRTLLVFTSDHGEGLGEHHEATHSYLVYNSTIHVPLILRIPGFTTGSRVEQTVGHVDIVPTILDLLGLPIPEELEGRSLAPLTRSGPQPREMPYYAESLSPRLAHGWGEQRVLFREGWKYIHGPRSELYHLPTDPAELSDRIENEPELAGDLEEALGRWLTEHSAPGGSVAQAPDADTRRRLEALGYLQGSMADAVQIEEVLSREGIAPQDRVQRISEISRVKELLGKGQALAARLLTEQLIEEDPESPYFLELHARAQMGLGELDGALEAVERILDSSGGSPGTPEILSYIGWSRFREGEIAVARELMQRAMDLEPSAKGLFLVSAMEKELGDADRELLALERAVEIDDSHGPSVVGLAVRLAQAGDAEKAEALFESAVATNPYYARGFFNFGAFLLNHGRPIEALERFHRCRELDPEYSAAYSAAAITLHDLGRVDEAQTLVAELEEQAPGSPEAATLRQRLAQESSR